VADNDWLAQNEGDQILRIGSGDTSYDTLLVAFITAVSQRLDAAVGPVVKRDVDDELHDGGGRTIRTRLAPLYSTPAITLQAFDGATTLTYTAEGFADVTDVYGYLLDPSTETGLYSGTIRARSYGADARFPSGRQNVRVSYTAGRFENTGAVPERYKQAARVTLENWWQMIRDSVGEADNGEYLTALSAFPTFAIPNAAREQLDDVWQGDGVDVVVV
jgi:hypothetical protein